MGVAIIKYGYIIYTLDHGGHYTFTHTNAGAYPEIQQGGAIFFICHNVYDLL